jgi:hypothetical protein
MIGILLALVGHALALRPALACPQALEGSRPVFRAGVTLVTGPVLVTDARGVPVRGIQPTEFRLYDNDVLCEIQNFCFEEQLPLAIGIVVDISDSQRSFLRAQRAVVNVFVGRMLPGGDHAFMVAVNQKVNLEAEFIGRPSGLSQVLLPPAGQALGVQCGTIRGRSLCGGTALWRHGNRFGASISPERA